MKVKSGKDDHCARLLKVIGDYRTLSIVMELRRGETRFCELQRAVGNLNPVTLTNRLKKLETAGFIDRRTESVDKLSVTYKLSKSGIGLLPILDEIQAFAAKRYELS